jgi:hypothetical protein
MSSDSGRIPIGFLTSGEKRVIDLYTEVKNYLQPRNPSLFEWHQYCDTPVWATKKSDGEPFYFWKVPPDSTTYVSPTVESTQLQALPNGHIKINFLPVPPQKYYCGDKEHGARIGDILRFSKRIDGNTLKTQ